HRHPGGERLPGGRAGLRRPRHRQGGAEGAAGGRLRRAVTPPRWLWVPAAGAVVLVVVPLAGLLAQVPVGQLWPLLTSETSLDALLLSLRTATAATVICVLLGTPLALLLARGRWPGQAVLRALVLVPLVQIGRAHV